MLFLIQFSEWAWICLVSLFSLSAFQNLPQRNWYIQEYSLEFTFVFQSFSWPHLSIVFWDVILSFAKGSPIITGYVSFTSATFCLQKSFSESPQSGKVGQL